MPGDWDLSRATSGYACNDGEAGSVVSNVSDLLEECSHTPLRMLHDEYQKAFSCLELDCWEADGTLGAANLQEMANQIWPQTKIGSQVLFFGNLDFDSCRFIPATPSALEIAHQVAMPSKRTEDQIVIGLQ